MPDIGIGALGYVGYGKEVTEGTAVAPAHFIAANSVSFDDSNDYLTPLQLRQSRDIVVAMPAPFIVSGTLETALPAHDIGLLLQSAFAATIVTSAYSGGGYSHAFTPGNASPTMTFETSAQDQLVMRYSGVRVNTMQIKATFGEIVTASFGLDGITRAKQGSASTPSYHSTSTSPFHFTGSKVQIGGTDSSIVKDLTFNVNNNVSHIGTLRSTRSHKRVALGAREMGLSMSIDFFDTTEYDRLLNDTEFAVQLYFEGPTGVGTGGTSNMSLKIDLPRVKYKRVGLPINAGDFLTQDVECTILKPVASNIATVTLVNNESSIA